MDGLVFAPQHKLGWLHLPCGDHDDSGLGGLDADPPPPAPHQPAVWLWLQPCGSVESSRASLTESAVSTTHWHLGTGLRDWPSLKWPWVVSQPGPTIILKQL